MSLPRPPAILLCGGFGTRLRPVVDDRPKVLAPVGGPGGHPLLDLQLRRLSDAGVTRVVLSAGYLADQIVEFVGDGSRWGIDATVIAEETPLGTGGALALAVRTLALTGPFLALNADSLTTVPIDELWSTHAVAAGNPLAANSLATIAVVKTDDPSRFGTVTFDALSLITGFHEKSAAPSEHPQQMASWINAGVYVVEAHALADVPPDEVVSLERDLFPSWIGRMFAFAAPGASLLDIGTPDDYARALEWINKQGWTAD